MLEDLNETTELIFLHGGRCIDVKQTSLGDFEISIDRNRYHYAFEEADAYLNGYLHCLLDHNESLNRIS